MEISAAEATAAYKCLKGEMSSAYAKAGISSVKGYTSWTIVNGVPHQSATHGNRYANGKAAEHYKKFEKVGRLPTGSVVAKDSFLVMPRRKAERRAVVHQGKDEEGLQSGKQRLALYHDPAQ